MQSTVNATRRREKSAQRRHLIGIMKIYIEIPQHVCLPSRPAAKEGLQIVEMQNETKLHEASVAENVSASSEYWCGLERSERVTERWAATR